MKHRKLDPAYLHQCFVYDVVTGALTWRVRPREHFKGGAGWHNFNAQFATRVAGTAKSEGRIEVKLNGRTYKAARIVWSMQTAATEFGAIDHVDGDPANNRVQNLREASPLQNARNRSHISTNSSGVTGVTWHTQTAKWWARVTVEGKTRSLGLHADKDTAAKTVYAAKHQLFEGFARA